MATSSKASILLCFIISNVPPWFSRFMARIYYIPYCRVSRPEYYFG
jgi:hypothetical protein